MRRIIMPAALGLALLGNTATAAAESGCQTKACEKRVSKRVAAKRASCRSKACKRRTCSSRACRARVSNRGFRPALASWYGPGLYGNTLGCGGTLTPGTHGVAHKSLPCGTRVRICAQRCLTVRVRDRGPYVGAREFDIMAATKNAIGFGSTGVVRVRIG